MEAIIIYIAIDSHVTVKENASTIVFEQNMATNHSRIMYGISGNWIIMNNACIIFQGNTGHNDGNIATFEVFDLTIENASITFNKNKVGRSSFVLDFLESEVFIEESELLFTSNDFFDNCVLFFLFTTNVHTHVTRCENGGIRKYKNIR